MYHLSCPSLFRFRPFHYFPKFSFSRAPTLHFHLPFHHPRCRLWCCCPRLWLDREPKNFPRPYRRRGWESSTPVFNLLRYGFTIRPIPPRDQYEYLKYQPANSNLRGLSSPTQSIRLSVKNLIRTMISKRQIVFSMNGQFHRSISLLNGVECIGIVETGDGIFERIWTKEGFRVTYTRCRRGRRSGYPVAR